jgi:enoyl-CoA hydratase/carnithine racemase
MSDIVTERSNGILRVELNRPEKKNALTAAMYTRLADIFNEAAKDEETRVVLWHGAGDAFSAGERRIRRLRRRHGVHRRNAV